MIVMMLIWATTFQQQVNPVKPNVQLEPTKQQQDRVPVMRQMQDTTLTKQVNPLNPHV